MKILVNRYYYTLAELADVDTGPGPITNVTNFNALLYKMEPIWTVGTVQTIEQTLFQDYLWPEYYNCPILFVDKDQIPWGAEVEPTEDDVEEALLPLLGRMHRWYKESYERYSVLIAALETTKTKLLGPVKIVQNGESSYTGASTASGTNTGSVQVSTSNSSSTSTEVDATVTSSGTNSGTVEVENTNQSSTATSESKTHKESDTPQSALASIEDGYISRAAIDSGNGTVDVLGSDSSTTVNNATSSETSATDSNTEVLSSGTSDSATTNNAENSSTTSNEGTEESASTVANDVETPIERFHEVQQKLRNLYADWANEFSRFVIQSAE